MCIPVYMYTRVYKVLRWLYAEPTHWPTPIIGRTIRARGVWWLDPVGVYVYRDSVYALCAVSMGVDRYVAIYGWGWVLYGVLEVWTYKDRVVKDDMVWKLGWLALGWDTSGWRNLKGVY